MYTMVITATIVTPKIKASLENIEFGKVICGQRMSVYVRFKNITQVRCDWSLS